MTRPPHDSRDSRDSQDDDGPSRDASGLDGRDGGGDTHFGFRSVPLGEKQAQVDAVFHRVAGRYDVMNDLMSAGLHRAWKDRLVALVNPPKRSAFRHLDVAGGTADVAFRILRAGCPYTAVTVLDINPDMLAVGRDRAEAKGLAGRLEFVEANAEALPFDDGRFDGYTVAFGIRNVPRIDVALREAYRVLKRGGHFLCLEFSAVDLPLLRQLYDAYSFSVIPRLGKMVAGDADSYRYLVESIRRFPEPEDFAAMIGAAGFGRTSFTRLSGGIVAIHSGWKL